MSTHHANGGLAPRHRTTGALGLVGRMALGLVGAALAIVGAFLPWTARLAGTRLDVRTFSVGRLGRRARGWLRRRTPFPADVDRG